MIVEDEPLIRAGLKKYFNWKELNVHTIVDAENGQEGMNIALQERPDFVITDIRMPKMNGLEMIEKLRPELPDTLFIILTGHNEFKYAQQAIHHGGVHDFLIKPLQYEKSLSSILACMAKLKAMRSESQMRSTLEQNNLRLKASQIVKHLLEDEVPLTVNSIQHLLKFTSKTYKYQIFVMTAIPHDISLSHHTRIWWRSSAESIISKSIEYIVHMSVNRQILTYFYKNKLYVIVVYDSPDDIIVDQEVEKQISDGLKRLTIEHEASIFLSVSKQIEDFRNIRETLQSTDNTLYQRFFEPDRYLFYSNTMNSIKEPHFELDQNTKNSILFYLENGSPVKIEQLVVNLARNIPQTSSGQLFTFLQEIISVIRQFAHKNRIPIEDVYNESLLNLAFVDNFYSIEDLFQWIASWIIRLRKDFLNNKDQINTQELQLFERIESFIRDHIDQDLTLNMIAEHFFYNPSYLSRLFKTKLNKNYMDFVKEIRIDIAQIHLQDPAYSVTDVCKICGYKSYKHFIKVFRSITNMTPTEYRNQLRS